MTATTTTTVQPTKGKMSKGTKVGLIILAFVVIIIIAVVVGRKMMKKQLIDFILKANPGTTRDALEQKSIKDLAEIAKAIKDSYAAQQGTPSTT